MKFRPNQRHQSQEIRIENALVRGDKITPIDALQKYGTFRLSAVIFNLRKKGYNIKTTMVGNSHGKKYAEYKITSE